MLEQDAPGSNRLRERAIGLERPVLVMIRTERQATKFEGAVP